MKSVAVIMPVNISFLVSQTGADLIPFVIKASKAFAKDRRVSRTTVFVESCRAEKHLLSLKIFLKSFEKR
jgi:hypothetical protein